MKLTKPELAEKIHKALLDTTPIPTGEDYGWTEGYPPVVVRAVELVWRERINELEDELDYLTWNGAS